MPKRDILILDQEASPWPAFLEEFFADTLSVIHVFHNFSEAGRYVSKHPVNLAFLKDSLLAEPLIQKLKTLRQSSDDFRIFELGADHPAVHITSYDVSFHEPLLFGDFQKKLTRALRFPASLDILLVDDEPEITRSLVDYLKERTSPSFKIRGELNGKTALAAILKKAPDVMLMDIKMPEMNGVELYREIKKRSFVFPVVVYFDAVLGEEVMELHRIGNPAIVEKGASESGAADMAALLLKMVYFA